MWRFHFLRELHSLYNKYRVPYTFKKNYESPQSQKKKNEGKKSSTTKRFFSHPDGGESKYLHNINIFVTIFLCELNSKLFIEPNRLQSEREKIKQVFKLKLL